MNINKILFDRYKREFFIKDITKIVILVNDTYMSEMSDVLNEKLDNGWIEIDFNEGAVLYKIDNTSKNEESLQDKLLHAKDMLAKALLEEEYQLAAELRNLINDIENEIKNNKME
jgi:hypothetical protein